MVETPDPTMGADSGGTSGAQFHRTSHRRVLLDPEVRPVPVVVGEVLAEQPPKMSAVDNDDKPDPTGRLN